jgi:hypothetical protein
MGLLEINAIFKTNYSLELEKQRNEKQIFRGKNNFFAALFSFV